MVHPYLRRRAGEEVIDYPNDQIRNVLHKTLGPHFSRAGDAFGGGGGGPHPGRGGSASTGDGCLAKDGVIERFRQKLMEGMKKQGLSETLPAGVSTDSWIW